MIAIRGLTATPLFIAALACSVCMQGFTWGYVLGALQGFSGRPARCSRASVAVSGEATMLFWTDLLTPPARPRGKPF